MINSFGVPKGIQENCVEAIDELFKLVDLFISKTF